MTSSHDVYDHILENGPSSETLFMILFKLKEAGQRKRVIQECIKAIPRFPHDLSLRRLLAETFFEEGLLAQAEAELDKALSQSDQWVPLYKLQADIYHREKRPEEAARSLRVYLAHRPDDREALDLLETLALPQETLPEIPPPAAEKSEPVPVLKAEEPEPFVEIPREEEAFVEEEPLPEIATPTLAEVYVNQGEIMEAISIYERIVDENPDDKASRRRIQELKAMLALEPPPVEKREVKASEKKEKMIATLEAWLEEMRKIPGKSVPA